MKEFRIALGLTQGDLAKLVGVSQSMIARCESKNRMLATTTHLRYLALYMTWLDHQKRKSSSKSFSATLNRQDLQARALLSKRIKDLEFQVKQLNRLLQQQKKRYEQVQQLSSILEVWRQAIDYKGAHIWMAYLEQHSVSELKHCSPSQQQLLLLQIRNTKALLANTRMTLKNFPEPL